MDPDHSGVLISDGRCSVRLRRAGAANELGYPTLIDVQAGPFSGSIKDDTVVFGRFREQMSDLYNSLSGQATLGSYEGFELVLEGNRTGAISGKVTIVAEHVPLIKLTFELSTDQSYLPAIIQQLDAEFPPPYRTGA